MRRYYVGPRGGVYHIKNGRKVYGNKGLNFGAGAQLSSRQQNNVNLMRDQGYPKRELTRDERRDLKAITQRYKDHQRYITNRCKGRNLTKREMEQDRRGYCRNLNNCVRESGLEANARYDAMIRIPPEVNDPEHLAQLYYAVNNYNRYRQWYDKQCSNYDRVYNNLDPNVPDYNPIHRRRRPPRIQTEFEEIPVNYRLNPRRSPRNVRPRRSPRNLSISLTSKRTVIHRRR